MRRLLTIIAASLLLGALLGSEGGQPTGDASVQSDSSVQETRGASAEAIKRLFSDDAI